MTVLHMQPQTATFDDWWQIQFHKTDKVMCRAKWDAITSPTGLHTRALDKSTREYVQIHLKATPEEIYEGQKRKNKAFFDRYGYDNQEQRQFVERPLQFLNRGSWMDE